MSQFEFRKINVNDVSEIRKSKEGRLVFRRPISEALGREPQATDLLKRHPFDVEIIRVPPHSIPYRYHAHSAQWEYYQILSGEGIARHLGGETPVVSGDAFLFKPGEAHQLRNDSDEDLVVLIVADNPIGEFGYYPDDEMWILGLPETLYAARHPSRAYS